MKLSRKQLRRIILENLLNEKPKPKTTKKIEGTPNVLFVGDSQTVYMGNIGYADLVLRNENFTGKKRAKNGAPLEAIAGFLEQEIAKDKYDIISIMGGGNSAHKTKPPYHLYDQMYDMAKDHGAIVVAITNPTKKNLAQEKRKKYPSNEKLADYVRKNSKPDIIIDANKLFVAPKHFPDNGIKNPHINRAAQKSLYEVWIKKVTEYEDAG